MPVYDFTCSKCKHVENNIIAKLDEAIVCEKCGATVKHDHPAPHTFTTIIPTYTGSKKYKAGYVHKFGNRPSTKTQVGYGGGISADHPTGGGKSQNSN